jgi:hypothetical protein
MTGLAVAMSTATQAIQVPVLTILGGNDLTACGTDSQGSSFDCSYGAIVASQERIRAMEHACHRMRFFLEAGIRMNHPHVSASELRVRVAVRLYGRDAAQRLFGDVPDDAHERNRRNLRTRVVE